MSRKLKINKKIIAILLLIFTLLGNVQPIFAASGSANFTGGQYSSGIQTTDHTGNGSMLIRRLINLDTGEKYTVFCAEHLVDFETGTIENDQL